jgi:hypothetical protein
VADGGLHEKILPEKLADGLHLGGRLNDDQILWHDGSRIPTRRPHGKGGASEFLCRCGCAGGTRKKKNKETAWHNEKNKIP